MLGTKTAMVNTNATFLTDPELYDNTPQKSSSRQAIGAFFTIFLQIRWWPPA